MSFLSQPITLQSVFGKKRLIGPITVQVPISERTTDTLTITKQPTQVGASMTDHSYMEPAALTMVILEQDNSLIGGLLSTFNSNGLAQLYQQFQDLQSSRVPFDVITPKRIYRNMLISTLTQNTDKTTEHCLSLSLAFESINLVSVLTAQVPRIAQRNAGSTGATQPAGKKSALFSLKEGVGALFKR